MVFFIENEQNLPLNLLKVQILRKARRSIVFYPEKAAEKKLNEYMLQKYNTKLKLMCLKIIKSSLLMKDYNNHIVLKVADPHLDKIARFITFGNMDYSGSQILEFALKYRRS